MAKCARRRPLCGERAVSISGRDRGALAVVMPANSRRHSPVIAGKDTQKEREARGRPVYDGEPGWVTGPLDEIDAGPRA
jgi:hypothetical protein